MSQFNVGEFLLLNRSELGLSNVVVNYQGEDEPGKSVVIHDCSQIVVETYNLSRQLHPLTVREAIEKLSQCDPDAFLNSVNDLDGILVPIRCIAEATSEFDMPNIVELHTMTKTDLENETSLLKRAMYNRTKIL